MCYGFTLFGHPPGEEALFSDRRRILAPLGPRDRLRRTQGFGGIIPSMDKEQYLISRLGSDHIGDDGAVIGSQVMSVDAFCEGTHFRREWMTPAQIGRKAMLVNLSDAVAMNARPQYALLAVGLPEEMDEAEIGELIGAIETTAAEWGCELIGGDTVGSEKLHLSITLISRSEDPLRRTGIREGDLLAYTGTLGESLRQLRSLEAGEAVPEEGRFYTPELRAGFVRRGRAYLRAGMDLSDGLYCDTNKLLEVNGLGMEILKNINPEEGFSGEEYEMLVAFAPEHREKLEKVALEEGTTLTVFARADRGNARFPCHSHHFG